MKTATNAKDKKGIIEEMYLFIMSDNNNYTNLIPSNLPIKQVSLTRNNDVLFREQVIAEALYDTGASHNCISEKLLEKLNEIEGLQTNVPEGAFYVFPDVSSFFGKSYDGKVIKDSNDLCLYLLDEALVALVLGDAFGAPNCIRISYAAAEETLLEAMRRIKVALSKLS
jgi:aspartate/methionine/tyrosine aminotransferase